MRISILAFWVTVLISLPACSPATVSPGMVQTAIAATQTAGAPAATSTPAISREIIDYIRTTETLTGKYQETTSEIQRSFDIIQEDPIQITNREWKLKLAANLVKLQSIGDVLGSIENVPPELGVADSWYKMVKSETRSFVINIEIGIDYMDPGKISISQENLINIVRYLNNARAEVRQFVP